MPSVSAKVAERLANGIKRFQPIVQDAKKRDVNESDTVIIVTDMLSEVFGYDKYSEITSEHAIRGTFCDLATKLDNKTQCLIEVKSVGTELKEAHTKQAVDYAVNEPVDWVALTNGSHWKVYKVTFGKPIGQELVVEFDVLNLNRKKSEDIETLFLLAKEGFQRSALGDYDAQRQALSKFCIGAMLQTDPIVEVLRRELRRMSPDVRIDLEQIRAVLVNEVVKREIVEGEKADEARKKVARALHKPLRVKAAAAAASLEKSEEPPRSE